MNSIFKHRLLRSHVVTAITAMMICSLTANAEPIAKTVAVPITEPMNLSHEILAKQVNERVANEGRTGNMHFVLTNKRGHQRKRTARIFHADANQETSVAIYFTAPSAIEDTAFLSLDRLQASDDENWLFLPATERVRRLPTSERGDYFMGTDLTYGDIKDNFKFSPDDWQFTKCAELQRPANELPCLAGTAKSEKIAHELGYGRFIASIDPNTWFPKFIRYFDPKDKLLKEVSVERQEKIGEAWTAMAFTLNNLKNSHSTAVTFTNMEYRPDLPTAVFAADALEFGVPALTQTSAREP